MTVRNPLKTQFHDMRTRLITAVLLLLTLGLSASWSHAEEAATGTEVQSVSREKAPGSPVRPYNDYALFIAGINNEKGSLAALESSPAWRQFSKSFDASWKGLEARQLTPMKQWAAQELGALESSRYTVFYPFSGADFANMYSLFPDAETYVMISLERVGRIPDFAAMSQPDLEAFFQGLREASKDLLDLDYFITCNLETALQGQNKPGILALLLLFMAREKLRVIDVQHWFMHPNASIEEMPALGPVTSERGSIPGVRIVFQREGRKQPQTLYYFRFNLGRGSFEPGNKLVSFLEGLGPFITLEKASQYMLFDPDFVSIRRFILDHSRHILQTDSGIPIKYFDPSIWNVKLFGTYRKPIQVFSYRYQSDLDELYKKTKKIPPLPFGIGYHRLPGTANLLLASRKELLPSIGSH